MSRMLPDYPDSGRIFAASKPQRRFNWPTQLFQVTSACSATPYRDSLFGPEFETSVFICEPANNVIHREVLETSGVSFVSHRAATETNSEFLASSDNWCRPVMVKVGPNGALYFADMYRLVIEHPEYFPDELKHRSDLRAGEDKGRIYRIYPDNAQLRPIPRLDQLGLSALVAALDSPNGWQRDTVQRLLVQSRKREAAPNLEKLVTHCGNPKARLQALCTLSGLNSLSDSLLVASLKDPHWAVRREAVALSESRFGKSTELDSRLLEIQNDPDLRVRYQVAFSLGEWPSANAGNALGRLMLKDWQDESMRIALLSSVLPHLDQVLHEVFDFSDNKPPPPGLAERLVELACQQPQETFLTRVLGKISRPVARDYADWQMAGLAGLVEALDKRSLTLAAFLEQTSPTVRQALARLGPLFDQARRDAPDNQSAESERLVAIRLLGRQSSDQQQRDVSLLGELLGPQNPSAVQAAALDGLRRSRGPETAQVLLHSWRSYGPNQRQAVLNTLFNRPQWTLALVAALEAGKIQPGELGAFPQQQLLKNADSNVRERSARLFLEISSDRKKIVEAYKDLAQLPGNRVNGHELFIKNCSICHRLRGEGQSIGPDLGTIADKPVQELVVAILDPNQAVDPAYTAYTAVTKDEREFSGVLASETAASIVLKLAGGAQEQILRADLKELTSAGRSLMPEGFEAGLKQQDLADLIAYMLNPAP